MYLTIFDLVLLLILFTFIAFGFALGFIQAVGALIGVVLGAWLAGQWYEPFGAWLDPIFLGNANAARVIAFIILFTIINRLVGLLFYIIGKVFGLLSIIPFTKTINRILGALLGFLEGTLVLGLILYFLARFSFSAWFDGVLVASSVARWLLAMANFLSPLLPALLRGLQTII